MATREKLQIGCKDLTIKQWLEKGLGIAKDNDFSAEEIEEYRAYVMLAKQLYSK